MKKPDLPKDTKTHYYVAEPVYDRYKTVKVTDRCYDCGHKIGSHNETRGVKIVGYEIKKYKKDIWYHMIKANERYMAKSLKNEINNFNLFTGKKTGSILKIKRYSEL